MLENEIRKDNSLQQEWNKTVNEVLESGGNRAEVTEYKTKVVTSRIAESEKVYGYQPGLFAGLMKKAIAVLREFLQFLLSGQVAAEAGAIQNSLSTSDHSYDVRNAEIKVMVAQAEYMSVDCVHEKISKGNRKVYAIDKSIEKLEKKLAAIPKGIFHRRERKEQQAKIDKKKISLDKATVQLEDIPMLHGYKNAEELESVYKYEKSELRKAPRELEALRKEGLPKAPVQAEEKCEYAGWHQESILMRLVRNRKLIDEREV